MSDAIVCQPNSSTQTNGIFELRIKNAEGEEGVWTIDLKKTGTVYKGAAQPKADVTLIMGDDTFASLADGKVRLMCFQH